ncbi:MAG: methionine--tRNA ligase [Bacilli bacterium]
MNRNILIGGAWPYANYLLHIGHLSALLPADIIARYHRGVGDNVIYVSGTDSHGTPVTERAKKEGKTAKEIASHYHEEFVKSFKKANFSYDFYTCTMTEEHKEKVKEYFKQIYDNGYIYEKTENQDFCPKCNKFLSDREIVGVCPRCGGKAKGDQCDDCYITLDAKDIKEKTCKSCGSIPINKENNILYFKLSAFQQQLEKYINSNKDIWRKNASGESKKFLDMGLIDRAATRELDWGVEVPIKGFEDKRIYVWIEAVLGYLTAANHVAKEKSLDFNKFMTDEKLISYYAHGKDNIPFHTVIYPALLMALKNNYTLPKQIVSGEYVNLNNEKMSKSKGNLLTVNEMIDKYGVDTSRYFMIANGPEKKDTNFTIEDIINAHNKFLVGVLGNFINRNFSFINSKFDGIIKEGTVDLEIIKTTRETYNKIAELIENIELKAALDLAFDYISLGNKYYDEKKPWILAKENIEEFNNVTYTCTYMIANISNLINPFMPNTSEKIKGFLGLVPFKYEEIILNGDYKINDLSLLFTRLENK